MPTDTHKRPLLNKMEAQKYGGEAICNIACVLCVYAFARVFGDPDGQTTF